MRSTDVLAVLALACLLFPQASWAADSYYEMPEFFLPPVVEDPVVAPITSNPGPSTPVAVAPAPVQSAPQPLNVLGGRDIIITDAGNASMQQIFNNVSHITNLIAVDTVSRSAGVQFANGTTVAKSLAGKLMFNTTAHIRSVDTKAGKIEIQPGAAAIIDTTGSHISVTAISGDKDSVSMTSNDTNHRVSLHKGEALIIANSDEELIPCDVGTIVEGNFMFSSRPAQKRKVLLEGLIANEITVGGIHVRVVPRRQKDPADSLRADHLHAGKPSCFSPVAMIGDAVPNTDAILTQMTADGGVYQLSSGSLFAETKNVTTFETPLGKIESTPGTVCLITVAADVVRVNVCHGKVTAHAANSNVEVRQGSEYVISNRNLSQDELFLADGVARRRQRSSANENHTLSTAEFDVATLLLSSKYSVAVKSILRDNHKLQHKLLKTAMALRYVTAGHGTFTAMVD